jgi:tRNA(fMet)-specific endonuclease VapC
MGPVGVMYLLDTNPCIVYLTGRSEVLRRRLDAVGNDQVAVCSIVCAELFFGAAKSVNPNTTLQRQQQFLERFQSLPFDDAAARIYGPLRADLERGGATIGANDLLIASISLANGLTLVSHNVGEFSRVPGLMVEDWEIGI